MNNQFDMQQFEKFVDTWFWTRFFFEISERKETKKEKTTTKPSQHTTMNDETTKKQQ